MKCHNLNSLPKHFTTKAWKCNFHIGNVIGNLFKVLFHRKSQIGCALALLRQETSYLHFIWTFIGSFIGNKTCILRMCMMSLTANFISLKCVQYLMEKVKVVPGFSLSILIPRVEIDCRLFHLCHRKIAVPGFRTLHTKEWQFPAYT